MITVPSPITIVFMTQTKKNARTGYQAKPSTTQVMQNTLDVRSILILLHTKFDCNSQAEEKDSVTANSQVRARVSPDFLLSFN
jgi:hypothetical protein